MVRCAIVGLGRIGWMLESDRLREKPCTHAGAIIDNNDCLLVGGCDIDSLRCEAFSDTFGISHTYTQFAELLEKTSPDILHIATPTESHYAIMQASLSSDVKLFVCEKPLVGPKLPTAIRPTKTITITLKLNFALLFPMRSPFVL